MGVDGHMKGRLHMNSIRLDVGDFGEAVARVHTSLKQHGFQIAPEEEKRKFFGPSTGEAVRACQKQHRLQVTGVVDAATHAALEAVGAAARSVRATRVTENEHKALTPELLDALKKDESFVTKEIAKQPISAPIKVNDQGPHVANLQDALRFLVERGKLDIPDPARGRILEALAREQARKLYGDVGTQLLVKVFQAQYQHPVTGEIDDETAAALNKLLQELGAFEEPELPVFIVRGQVRYADGTPASDQQVRAFDKDLRTEEPLGDPAITDKDGRYEIPYTAQQFRRAEKGSADLIVRAFNGVQTPPVSSPIIFNAQPVETVDLTVDGVYRGPSEYDELIGALTPVLQDVPLHELTDEDINFLTGDTGLERQRIFWLRESAKREEDTKLVDPDIHTHVAYKRLPSPVFYGWFRQNLPTDLDALVNQQEDALRLGLEAALRENIIPVQFRELLDQVFSHWREFKLRRMLQPAPEGTRASLGDLLNTMSIPLELEKQRTVAEVVTQHGVADERFRDALKDKGFDDADINHVQVTLKLGELTQGHPPLMRALQARRTGSTDGTVAYLAELTTRDWLDLTYTHGSGSGVYFGVDALADSLERQIETDHPTRVIAARLKQGQMKPEGFPSDTVATFLADHRPFDFLSHDVPKFLHEQGVSDDGTLKNALQRLQRVVKLSAGWNEAQALLNNGLDSSLKIVQMGRNGFRKQMEPHIPENRAALIYTAADQVFAGTLALATVHGRFFNPIDVPVLPGPKVSDETLKDYPILRTLFGDLDYCECRHCRSVLSPAAYLVDLLQCLSSGRALGTLLSRRPDLADLHLSCENTNTEMPYVDLVLELLENAVALPSDDIPLAASAITALEQGRVPSAVRNELTKTAIAIGDQLTVMAGRTPLILGGPIIWTITDGSRSWSVWLWRQQLLARRPQGFWTQGVPISDFNETLNKLRRGGLSAELEKYLVPDDLLPLLGTPQVEVPSKKERLGDDTGEEWLIRLSRAVAIRIIMGGPVGGLVWQTLDGTSLKTTQLPTALLREVIAPELTSGRLPRLLAIELPLLDYKITWNAAKNQWELSTLEIVGLRYQPERLRVASLTYNNSSVREDLLTYPENRNPEAYRRLDQAIYPWLLPLNLFFEEVRAYLEKLGVPRLRLLEVSRPQTWLQDPIAARETLGLSASQAQIIFTPTQNADRPKYWGLSEQNNEIEDLASGETVNGDWITVLTRLSVLLQRSGLDMRELLNLLETRFIASLTPTVSLQPPFECKPSRLKAKDLGSGHLDRMHRFGRLWRVLGWSMHELDRIIGVLGSGANPDIATDEFLIAIAHVQYLHQHLSVPVRIIACWFGAIEVVGYTDHTKEGEPIETSLYAATFLNPKLQRQYDPDLILNSQSSELAYIPGSTIPPTFQYKKITEKADLIAAALSIKKSDLLKLVGPTSAQEVTDGLTLNNLSALYRIVSLIKALGLTVEDYLRLHALLDMHPFSPNKSIGTPLLADAKTKAVLAFVEQVEFIRQSGVTLDELDYLLRHEVPIGSALNALPERHTRLLIDLRTRLNGVRQAVLEQVSEEGLRAQLGRLGWSPDLIDAVLAEEGLKHVPVPEAEVKPAPTATPAIPVGLPFSLTTRLWLRITGQPTAQDFTALAQANQANPAIVEAVQRLQGLYDNRQVNLNGSREIHVKTAPSIPTGLQAQFSTVKRTWLGIAKLPKLPDSSQFTQLNTQVPVLIGAANELQSLCEQLKTRIHALYRQMQSFVLPSFETKLVLEATLPSGRPTTAALPKELQDWIDFTPGTAVRFAGFMTRQERKLLEDWAQHAPSYPQFADTLDKLSVRPVIPTDLQRRLYYDATKRALVFTGWMTENDAARLKSLLNNAGSTQAIDGLKQQSDAYQEQLSIKQFLTEDEAQKLLAGTPVLDERYRYALQKIVTWQQREAVLPQLSEEFHLELPVMRALAETGLASATNPDPLGALFDPYFVESDENVRIDSRTFPPQYSALAHLEKVTLLLSRMQLKVTELPWITAKDGFATLELASLPLSRTSPAKHYAGWRKLVTLFSLRNHFPEGSRTIAALHDALTVPSSTPDKIHALLARAFDLPEDEVAKAFGTAFLTLQWPDDYRDPQQLLYLAALLRVCQVLGASSDTIKALIAPSPDVSTALRARELLHSRYGVEGVT
jgi:peptidoglycan hydrolase-like protein with peptidoglycan-binding domain